MKIAENPFAILAASPRDHRHKLMEKADEAALLNGTAVEDALGSLMKMNQRIEAEVSWFPDTDPAVAESFLNYEKALAENGKAILPSMEGLGCPLAQANALVAFYEAWPVFDPECMVGLYFSMDKVLSQITVSGTLEAINRDREAGAWERIPDELTLTEPLNDRLREIVQILGERMKSQVTDQSLLEFLNRLIGMEADQQSIAFQAVSDAYIMRIHDQEEKLRNDIISFVLKYKDECIPARSIPEIQSKITDWCTLTSPLRQTAGQVRSNATQICQNMRNCIVTYANKEQPIKEKRMKTIPIGNGTIRTVTLNYDSRKPIWMQAINLSDWLITAFPEQADFVNMLKEDRKKLQEMIENEERMVMIQLNKAR